MTTVSVIIPVFNDAAYIGEALSSALGQTHAPFELIVVDDGSTDGSADVARSFGDAVTVISQPNGGISSGRNTGLAAATGEVIAFLDADDIWPLDSIALRLAPMEADPGLSGAYGLVDHFLSPDLDEERRARLHCPEGLSPARFAGAMLIRREMFDRIGAFDTTLKVGEMIDWAARFSDSGAKAALVEALVMSRRIHGGNTMISERSSHGDYLKALRASLARKAAAKSAETPA